MYERAHTEGQMDTMAARALRAVSEALGQKGKDFTGTMGLELSLGGRAGFN